MSDYLFKPETSFLNSVFLGDSVGNRAVDPQLRQIIATNQTRDAVRELVDVQQAARVGQQQSLAIQAASFGELRGVGDAVESMNQNVEMGLDNVSRSVSQLSSGMSQMSSEIANLSDDVVQGFETLGLGMQSGFKSVVRGLYDIDERLGARLMTGFAAAARQSAVQHTQLVDTLLSGFDSVIAAGQQQTEAILTALAEVNHNLRHQAANEALEHFEVGMSFLNRRDVPRALEQFAKARRVFAGHFPTLFAEGFCWYVLGQPRLAEDRLTAALSQTDPNPDRAKRQQAWAALYLGRLAFDRHDYNAARQWFHQTYRLNPKLRTALVEASASLLLDPQRPPDATQAVKAEFNQSGKTAYMLWYLLALTLAPREPNIAVEAFRHGAHGDERAQQRDRVAVIEQLWQLNSRTAGVLLSSLVNHFPWLR